MFPTALLLLLALLCITTQGEVGGTHEPRRVYWILTRDRNKGFNHEKFASQLGGFPKLLIVAGGGQPAMTLGVNEWVGRLLTKPPDVWLRVTTFPALENQKYHPPPHRKFEVTEEAWLMYDQWALPAWYTRQPNSYFFDLKTGGGVFPQYYKEYIQEHDRHTKYEFIQSFALKYCERFDDDNIPDIFTKTDFYDKFRRTVLATMGWDDRFVDGDQFKIPGLQYYESPATLSSNNFYKVPNRAGSLYKEKKAQRRIYVDSIEERVNFPHLRQGRELPFQNLAFDTLCTIFIAI
ncbi:MAG: hypothetical protein M1833_005160 [Piccolia ochrophora]|nr:MAG: hypothetical protein M1833_005160 [Piccolia ochrophora]